MAAAVGLLVTFGCTSNSTEAPPIQLAAPSGDLHLPSELQGEPRALKVQVDSNYLLELEDHPLAYSATVHWADARADVVWMHGVLRLIDGCVIGLQRPEDGGITHLLFNPVNYEWDAATDSVIRRDGYGDNSVRATWHVPEGSVDEEYHGDSPDERYLGNLELSTPLESSDLLTPTKCDTGAGTTWVYVD